MLSSEEQHFGTVLRRGREARGMTIAEVSRATKIKECQLIALEAAALDQLPAPVFVRGFACAYARAVGLDEAEVLAALAEKLAPVVPSEVPPKAVELVPDQEPEGASRMSVALVVLLILVVATLTLSLLLRHPTRPGGPISQRGGSSTRSASHLTAANTNRSAS